jgi:hypothetical protein
MSVNRPQTFSIVIAILTLFAAAAWGQQEAGTAVNGSNLGAESLVNEDGFLKGVISNPTGISVADLKDEILENSSSAPPAPPSDADDSLFGSSSKSLVDSDGYFLSASNGELWKDASPLQSVELPAIPESATETPVMTEQPSQLQVARNSKLRLRVGFDVLSLQRGRAENTIFATDDNGKTWAFSDFDFTEGDARYFVQFMGDDLSGFELTFYDFDTLSSTIEATGEDVVPFFFQANPATITNNYDFVYRSRLKNVEVNSWLRHNEFQRSGYGVRHINLDETFDVLTNGSLRSGLFSRTDNDLWGLTRMWERRRPLMNRLTVIGGADVGLYLNRVKIDVDTLNVDDSSEGKNLASTLGFNLGLEYQAANHVTLRFGYEGLGLLGVGLASTQSLDQDILNGLNDPEIGSIYFGGFHFGAIATF